MRLSSVQWLFDMVSVAIFEVGKTLYVTPLNGVNCSREATRGAKKNNWFQMKVAGL